MVEYKKVECLCGEMIHTSVWGTWVDDQWFCGECLVKAVSKNKKTITKIEEEIIGIEESLLITQNNGTRNLREHENKIKLVGFGKGELRGLRFALGLLKSEK